MAAGKSKQNRTTLEARGPPPGLPFPFTPSRLRGGRSQIQGHIIACRKPKGPLIALGITLLLVNVSPAPFDPCVSRRLRSSPPGLPRLRSPKHTAGSFQSGFSPRQGLGASSEHNLPALSWQEKRKRLEGRSLAHLAFVLFGWSVFPWVLGIYWAPKKRFLKPGATATLDSESRLGGRAANSGTWLEAEGTPFARGLKAGGASASGALLPPTTPEDREGPGDGGLPSWRKDGCGFSDTLNEGAFQGGESSSGDPLTGFG